jgi:hypothetical protein
MADEPNAPPPPPPPMPTSDAGAYHEFGTAKRSLPPAAPVAVALALVGLIIAVVMYINRAKPAAQGGINGVYFSQPTNMPSPMILIGVTLHNVGDKTLYIKDIKGAITTDQGDQSDEAAAARDYDRYLGAYPDLQGHGRPLQVETKIAPGGEQTGTVLISPSVTKEQFDARKDTVITIEPYDQAPIVLHEKSSASK